MSSAVRLDGPVSGIMKAAATVEAVRLHDTEEVPPMHPHRTDKERFWAKVDINGPVPEYNPSLGNCWIWIGTRGADGYGRFYFVPGTKRRKVAHRWLYESIFGPIPSGFQLDHLCRVRYCVRPSHLEVVTCAENIARGETSQWQRDKTHCPQGHPYAGDNLFIRKRGGRVCGECRRSYDRKRPSGWERQRIAERSRA